MNIADLNSETRELCNADTTSLPNATLLYRVNNGYQQVIGWIINADGTWQFDDTNYSDLPRGRGTLVQGQEDYSFSSEYLDVEAVEILNDDSPNKYIRIEPLDHSMLGGLSPQEYFGLLSTGSPQTGFPQYYDKLGDTIFLYPAPTSTEVTLTNGIRVWFKRTADLFTSAQVTTGTKEPGFASPWHIILAYMAAIPYCSIYKPERVAWLQSEVNRIKAEIIDFYGLREKDKRKVITMKPISFR